MGATSYNVYCGTATGVTTGNGTKVTGATSGSAVTGLINGTTYYLRVTAVNAAGESATSGEVSATPNILSRKVPDTGQTTCYDSGGIVIACAGTGQDGAYSINPPSYTDNSDSTITDNVTGLMWQKQDDATDVHRDIAELDCYSLSLGGQNDWRLPSAGELQSIVNYGTYNPTINATYFPGTQSSHYWSSTTYAYSANYQFGTNYGFTVDFTTGYFTYLDYVVSYANVRCVRGQQIAQSFNENGDGTITDKVTGMMWQKQDDAALRTWDAAITYCEGLTLAGFSDWRLPNVKELSSIVDYTVYSPSINTTYFRGTQPLDYWSSTTYANLSDPHAWLVYFKDGYVSYYYKTSANYVRCVRLGQ